MSKLALRSRSMGKQVRDVCSGGQGWRDGSTKTGESGDEGDHRLSMEEQARVKQMLLSGAAEVMPDRRRASRANAVFRSIDPYSQQEQYQPPCGFSVGLLPATSILADRDPPSSIDVICLGSFPGL